MNTSGSSVLGLCSPLASSAAESENDDQKEIASRVFAALLAPPPVPVPVPPAPVGNAEPLGSAAASEASTSWRTSASAMTGAPAQDNAGANGLVTQIETESLGRVRVAVDQVGGTVRVAVSAERAEVFSALHAQQAELLAQLQSAGITVSSLSLVRTEPAGIGLARERSTGTAFLPKARSEDESQDESDDPLRTRRGRSRAVNLTG